MKKYTKILLRSIGFIILIFLSLKVDWINVKQLLAEIQIEFLLLSILVIVNVYLLKSYRLKILLKKRNIHISFFHALTAFSASNFIAFITPGRIGEIAKAFYINNSTRTSLARTIPITIIDRIYDVLALCSFAIIGFLQFTFFNSTLIITIILGILVFGFVVLKNLKRIILFLINVFARLGIKKLVEIKKNTEFKLFIEELNFGSLTTIIPVAVVTISAYLVIFLSAYLIVTSLQLDITYIQIILFISIANIISFVPISISGVGTREGILVVLFSQIGYSANQAIIFSTLFFLVFYIFGGLFGFAFFLNKPVSINSLKKNTKV